MSGETEKQVSGWTVDTLHALMNERDRRYEERFLGQEKAVLVALDQTKTRFENVNEWRSTVSDLLHNAMPRPEADTRATVNNEKFELLNSRLDRIEARSGGQHSIWLYLIGAIAALGAIGSLINIVLNMAAK